jgi:acetyltransferase-like isoleucine patch superfamily enzyme
VYIANHASIVSATHPVDVEFIGDQPLIEKSVMIKDHVWIGSHAVILPGVTLGRSSVIAAGAVVTHDVPPYAVVAGVPAKIVRFKSLGTPAEQASGPLGRRVLADEPVK